METNPARKKIEHRRHARIAVWLCSLAALSALEGCGRHEEAPVATDSQRIGGVYIPEGGASAPWVSADWVDLDVHSRLALPASFGLVMSNNAGEDVTVGVTLESFGLDTRKASIFLGSLVVPARASFTVPIDLSWLPIRSVGSVSSVHASLQLYKGRAQRQLTTSRLAYEFDPGLSTITLWGSTARRFALANPRDPRQERMQLAALDATLLTPQGDVWNGSSFVPVASLPPVGGAGYQIRGSVDFWEAWPASVPAPGTPLDGPPGPTKVCGTHTWKFYDANVGEDYFWMNGFNAEPARYTAALLENYDTGQAVWAGWLGSSGCTPSMDLPAGTYGLTLASKLRTQTNSGAVTVDVETEQSFDYGGAPVNTPVVGYARTLFDVHPGPAPTTVQVGVYLTTVASNILVVGGRMFDMPDHGLSQGHIRVTTRDPSTNNIDCSAGGGEPPISWASTSHALKQSTICLGRKNTLDPSDGWSKFVVGHEFGHAVQGLGMGNLTTDYDNPISQPLCRCDHVGSSNQYHCLQSQEHIGAGASEGFAHLYASRIFNHQEQSDCAFGYYKEFMDSSYTVQQPPVAVSCKTPVKWLENQCLTANRGVEYDWMNFLYDINSAPSSQRTSLSNLWQVYLTACSPPECESENLSWSALDNGAKAYYGTNNLRYLKLVASGSNFGVNH